MDSKNKTLNRFKSRVKLNFNNIQDCFPTWETVEKEAHRGVFWAHYIKLYVYMIYQECIKYVSKVILFADDTNVLITDRDYNNFKQKIKFALSCVYKWFQANLLVRNIEEMRFVNFTPKYSVCVPLAIECADEIIEET